MRTHASAAVPMRSRLLCMRAFVLACANALARACTRARTHARMHTHRWFSKYEVDKVDAIVITHEHADAMLVRRALFLFFVFPPFF